MDKQIHFDKYFGARLSDSKEIELIIEQRAKNIELRICSMVDTLLFISLDNEGVRVLADMTRHVVSNMTTNYATIGCMTINDGHPEPVCISMMYDGGGDVFDLHFYRGLDNNKQALMISCSSRRFERLVTKMLLLTE